VKKIVWPTWAGWWTPLLVVFVLILSWRVDSLCVRTREVERRLDTLEHKEKP
jgi:hypothetical protein